MPAMDYSQVADIYDIYAKTDCDVGFFCQEAKLCKGVLELMSGTGRLSIPLLEAGIPLSCLDSSSEMLAVFRRKLSAKGLSAPVFEMDVCDFSLPGQYDLILIPFNSFAEIVKPDDQRRALASICEHLTAAGHLVCTLHNPAVRLSVVDGQLRQRGRFPLPDASGMLCLSSEEHYDPATRLVSGTQVFEILSPEGVVQSRRSLMIKFFLHDKESFERLIREQGFRVQGLWGDYDRSEFRARTSPFMIWLLDKEQGS